MTQKEWDTQYETLRCKFHGKDNSKYIESKEGYYKPIIKAANDEFLLHVLQDFSLFPDRWCKPFALMAIKELENRVEGIILEKN